METIVSLSIFCSLTIFSICNLKDYQARVEERQYLEWFKDSFKSTFNYCYLHNTGGRMVFDKEKIIFHTSEGTRTQTQSKKIPKSLKITSGARTNYTINKAGEASAATIIIESSLNHKKILYKIQMNWGEIVETES
ncbi:hypothetical protein [Companilactobacillus futsaii]|nr:hypothetical protein [Companilactobacillus futsaii]